MSSIYRHFGKRVLDITLAGTGGVLLLPMTVGLAIAILFVDGRPVLFRQRRIGQHGRPFILLKFRTMSHDADQQGTITIRCDARVTRLGAILRRYKFDELPQIWNVLKGEMSLVGPRPDVPGYADRLEGVSRRILELRPGITGPASLAFRDEEVLLAGMEDPKSYNDNVIYPQKVALNLEYLDRCCLRADLGYIVQTVVQSLRPQ